MAVAAVGGHPPPRPKWLNVMNVVLDSLKHKLGGSRNTVKHRVDVSRNQLKPQFDVSRTSLKHKFDVSRNSHGDIAMGISS